MKIVSDIVQVFFALSFGDVKIILLIKLQFYCV